MLWWKIIIIGMVKEAGHYTLFSTDDSPEHKLAPKQFENKQAAEGEAQKIVGNLIADNISFVHDSIKIIVLEVPMPDFSADEELEEQVRKVLEPYMTTQFLFLLESPYWQRAVEEHEVRKKYELGFKVFLSNLERDCPAWKLFRNEHSERIDVVISGLRKCFETHYRNYESKATDSVTA